MATMAQNGKVVLQHLLQTLITLGAILQAANALKCFSSNKYTPSYQLPFKVWRRPPAEDSTIFKYNFLPHARTFLMLATLISIR